MKRKKLRFNITSLFFKRWNNKSFSVFRSISKIIKICFLLATYTIISEQNASFAQVDTIAIEEIKVFGQRGLELYPQIARVVTVIDSNNIENAPVQSIQDLLEHSLNVDIRQRGYYGAQADISIRGGSFDHVLILLNGINITDPQTGHYNLDLPVEIEDIKRIEILNGPSARIH